MQSQLGFSFLHALFAPRCLGCRLPLRPGARSFCFSCFRFFLAEPPGAGALFGNSGPGRGFLRALRGEAPERAAAFAFSLLRKRGHLDRWKRAGVEIVLHAPQNARRERSGLAILAGAVATELSARFVPGAFRKQAGRSQHGRALASRMDTPCFLELVRPGSWVKGRHLLVLDDVNTTGTTLDLCAFTLRRAGAARVRRFALAHQEAQALSPPSDRT